MIRHYGTLEKVAKMEAARSKKSIMSEEELKAYHKSREKLVESERRKEAYLKALKEYAEQNDGKLGLIMPTVPTHSIPEED